MLLFFQLYCFISHFEMGLSLFSNYPNASRQWTDVIEVILRCTKKKMLRQQKKCVKLNWCCSYSNRRLGLIGPSQHRSYSAKKKQIEEEKKPLFSYKCVCVCCVHCQLILMRPTDCRCFAKPVNLFRALFSYLILFLW